MTTAIVGSPPWLTNFEKFKGIHEIKGKLHEQKILDLIDWGDGRFDGKRLFNINDDETAYCASALCGSLEMIGIRSPRSPAARSFDKWGEMLGGPAVGAIVTFWRKSPTSGLGHVGIVVGRNSAGELIVYGANQDDQFKYSAFKMDRVVGYRWPTGYDKPSKIGFTKLPITSASPSRSEA
jgi:uncharacterized protein (TIGR02594 family)